VLLGVSFLKQSFEMLFVTVSSHEGWRETRHEDLSELSISLIYNLWENLIVLLEIGLN
jgi:hypothetical protein